MSETPPVITVAPAPLQTEPLVATEPVSIPAGFNWGAFWLTWIWGLSHGIWVSILLLFLDIGFVAVSVVSSFFGAAWVFSLVFLIINLLFGIWFGRSGNAWAWKRRGLRDAVSFARREKSWSTIGWLLGVLMWAAYLVSAFNNPGVTVDCSDGVSFTINGVEQCPQSE